ncbi:MAG: hypothetical protein ACFE9M_13460 [Promethearchaeota archaeon]
MDYKDFHDGLLSLALILFLFSVTLMIGSIVLKPFIGIQSQERDLIVILCSINILFTMYYLWNVLRLEKIFKLENKNIIKFGKTIGIVTLIYIPHFIVFSTLFFRNLHNLEIIMIVLIVLMEVMLIGVVLKEVYDLVFLEESQRNFEIEADRKKYIERNKK